MARTGRESPEGVMARLRQTITELSAENAALKARLAGLGCWAGLDRTSRRRHAVNALTYINARLGAAPLACHQE